MTLMYGEEATLNDNGFEKAGYIFKRWNTLSNGTGLSYANKDVVKNLSKNNNDVVNLYAIWSSALYSEAQTVENEYSTIEVTPKKYNVKFHSSGAAGHMSDVQLKIGEQLPSNEFIYSKSVNDGTTTITREGTFLGWTTNTNKTDVEFNDNEIFVLYKDGDEVDLYAIWKVYTVETDTLTGEVLSVSFKTECNVYEN